jgi:hypothetical protein
MNRSRQFFTKYQFPLFFLLAYLLSWPLLLVPDLRGQLPHGVAFAAVIVIALAMGRVGLREFGQRLTNFRGGWWYLAGPAIVAGYYLAGLVLNILMGAKVTAMHQLSAGSVFEFLFLGGMWEEPGWTGYALPALQKRFARSANGALIATLIVGAFRSIWHIPLIFWARFPIPWYDALLWTPLVFQVIISWLYNKSGGSVPVVMFFHLMSNIIAWAVSPIFAGPDKAQFTILAYVSSFLFVLVIAWRTGFKFGWREGQD